MHKQQNRRTLGEIQKLLGVDRQAIESWQLERLQGGAWGSCNDINCCGGPPEAPCKPMRY